MRQTRTKLERVTLPRMSSGTFKNLIGGQWVDGADGAYEIHNPANGSLVGHAPEASVQQSLDAARAARTRSRVGRAPSRNIERNCWRKPPKLCGPIPPTSCHS